MINMCESSEQLPIMASVFSRRRLGTERREPEADRAHDGESRAAGIERIKVAEIAAVVRALGLQDGRMRPSPRDPVTQLHLKPRLEIWFCFVDRQESIGQRLVAFRVPVAGNTI